MFLKPYSPFTVYCRFGIKNGLKSIVPSIIICLFRINNILRSQSLFDIIRMILNIYILFQFMEKLDVRMVVVTYLSG